MNLGDEAIKQAPGFAMNLYELALLWQGMEGRKVQLVG